MEVPSYGEVKAQSRLGIVEKLLLRGAWTNYLMSMPSSMMFYLYQGTTLLR